MFKNFTPKRLVAVALLAGGFAVAAPTVVNAVEQPVDLAAGVIDASTVTDVASAPAVWEWDEWE
ncbi:hypothetical protein [Gulosibacter faecalis]|jgi:hypothetical protein|uniref:hypothetical protein n=1 Tax=Gulosibacter faecalis TaxID=272240 RepID=UPI00036F0883|nr:hypothetical protein [Gulosibacter faecalis]